MHTNDRYVALGVSVCRSGVGCRRLYNDPTVGIAADMDPTATVLTARCPRHIDPLRR